MIDQLILHPKTAAQLAGIITDPPHALLLSAPAGMGKSAVARSLAEQILGLGLSTYAYGLEIQSEPGKAIGIEAVRNLEHFISLKIPAERKISRIIIIHDAHMLTIEAQNALLKTLEEPPTGALIILTAANTEALLPTVRSRLQTLEILSPPADRLLTELGSNSTQIMALSGGLPGLALALAADDQSHPLVQAAGLARQLLQISMFERLCLVDGLAKDKDQALQIMEILARLSRAALLNGRTPDRWRRVLQSSYDAAAAIKQGASTKLSLTNLMLNL